MGAIGCYVLYGIAAGFFQGGSALALAFGRQFLARTAKASRGVTSMWLVLLFFVSLQVTTYVQAGFVEEEQRTGRCRRSGLERRYESLSSRRSSSRTASMTSLFSTFGFLNARFRENGSDLSFTWKT